MDVNGGVLWVVWMMFSIHLNRISAITGDDEEADFKDVKKLLFTFHVDLQDDDPHTRRSEAEKLLKADCLEVEGEDYEKAFFAVSREMADVLYAVTVRIYQLWPEIQASQDCSVLYEDDIFKQVKSAYEEAERKFLEVFPKFVLGRARRLQLQNTEWSKEDFFNLLIRGTRWLLTKAFEGLIAILYHVDRIADMGKSNCSDYI